MFKELSFMTSQTLPDHVAEAATRLKDKVNGLSQSAAETIDETRRAAAVGLDRAASAMHDGGERVADLVHSTADKLRSTAKYLRNNDAKTVLGYAQNVVRNNLAASLVVAGIIGYSVGRSLRSGD
jgi:hypothetical protein